LLLFLKNTIFLNFISAISNTFFKEFTFICINVCACYASINEKLIPITPCVLPDSFLKFLYRLKILQLLEFHLKYFLLSVTKLADITPYILLHLYNLLWIFNVKISLSCFFVQLMVVVDTLALNQFLRITFTHYRRKEFINRQGMFVHD